MKTKNRFLASLLVLVMVLTMLPMGALAAWVDDVPLAAVPAGEEAPAVPVTSGAQTLAGEEDGKPRHYFTSLGQAGSPWRISDSQDADNKLSNPDGSGGDLSAISDSGNYRVWAVGGFLNFDLSGGNLLTKKLQGGQNAVPIHVEKQGNGAYLISRVHTNNTTYYLTAQNQDGRAVFSPNEADAVPYFIEANGTAFSIYCKGPYTVSFAGEGVSAADVEVMYGQKAALPTPTREGYTFRGWSNGEAQVTGEMEVTADVALTAVWEKDEIPVYTPADAIAEGKGVHYLAKNGTTGWTIQDTPAALQVKDTNNAAVTGQITDGGKYRIYGSSTGSNGFYAPFTNAGAGVTDVTAQGSTGSDMTFSLAEGSNGYQIHVGEKYLSAQVVDFTFQGNPWKGIQLGAAAAAVTYYVTPAAETNDGTYYIWYATDREDPTPEPPSEQTYATPAEAEADGKVVKYLSFNPNPRYWSASAGTSSAKATVYQFEGTLDAAGNSTAVSKNTTGIVDGGIYVIVTEASADGTHRAMHYGSAETNQCSFNNTVGDKANHLFTFEAANGGFSIRPANVADKYLSLDAASSNQRVFKDEKTTFYVTPAASPNDGTYYIWTANEPELGSGFSAMFDTSADNTWVFVGGKAVQGSFAEIGLARTLAGQFEEYIRWEKRGSASDEGGSPQNMQRYVTNTAYDGQTLNAVVSDAGWARVTALAPRAAVYMTGAEDAASETFAADLKSFIDKSLALRDNSGFAVVIKGQGQSELNAAVDTVAAAYTGQTKTRIAVVDGALTDAQLTGEGYPNAKGHLELAKKLAEAVTGGSANFPTSKNDATAIANGTWADRLTDTGVTVFGAAPETLSAAQQAVKAKMDAGSVTWLFMGDSITHGALWAEGDGTISQNFEKFVKDDLDRKGDVVINTAVSGATSATTVREIQVRLNKYSPDVVSIMIGTNDAAGKRVAVDAYKTNLNTILTAIWAKDAIAVLRTPIPDGAGGRGENIHEYADAVWAVYNGLTDEQKAKVIVVDQFAQWAPYLMTADNGTGTTFLFGKVFTQDGNKIHPGPVGHLWMTQELIDGLGLWDSSKDLCKLSYAQDWGITNENSAVSLADACAYDKDSRTLSLSLSGLGLSGTVISAELTAVAGGETYTVSYLRGQEGALSVTFPAGAETASISAAALVSESASAGKKVTFAAAEVDLNADVEHPKMPAPEQPEYSYEYRLASGEFAEGAYVIVASSYEGGTNNLRAMHYWTDTRTALDQCQSGTTNVNAPTVSFSDIAANHLWDAKKTADGKYTFEALTAKGNYLTGGAGTLTRGTAATEFTVTARDGGGYDVSWVNGTTTYYLNWVSGSKWHGAAGQYRINLYRKTAMPLTMAQTKFSGTSTMPMDEDQTNSTFRIPALITLDNGWIVAASDIRWPNTADSPNNLDTIVSVSKDGGATWDWEIINYFSDFAPLHGVGTKLYSASFIDPALAVDGDGDLWMAVDLQPTYVNLGKNGQKTGSGFDEDGLLMAAPISETEWETKVNTTLGRTEATRLEYQAYYEYRVDVNSVREDSPATTTTEKDGKTVTLFPIFHATEKWVTGYYVDAFFDLYYDFDEGGIQPVIVAQKESNDFIQANLFYIQSPWKAYSTTYLMVRKATVNEQTGKLDWQDPKLVSGVKHFDGETFLAFCPGRGTVITLGDGTERIIFPVYDNVNGEKSSVVYSDDGGATWHRGGRIPNGQAGKTSESQVVELPSKNADGTPVLRIYSRNTNSYISYADSTDGGVTWSGGQLDNALKYGSDTMVSFINLKGCLVSPDGTIYENLILASYPWGGAVSGEHRRSNGVVRIGTIGEGEGHPVTWLNANEVRYEGRFNYSCLTQYLDEENNPTDAFGLLYEKDGGKGMLMPYHTLTTEDLLGEGWFFLPEALTPEQMPAVSVTEITSSVNTNADDADLLDLNVATAGTVSVTLQSADGTVTWTSSDPSVATVETGAQPASLSAAGDVIAASSTVTIRALAPGRTVITATASANGIHRSAEIEVIVSDPEGEITVPDRYADEVAVETEPAYTQYELDTDGVSADIYAIVGTTASRSASMHDSGTQTNQCGASISNGILAIEHDAHKWTFARQTDGKYTICANGGKYLTSTATGNQLTLSATAEAFTVTHKGNGTYTVQNAAGKYLAFPDTSSAKWAFQDAEATVRLFQKVDYPESNVYMATAANLQTLIAKVEGKTEADFADVLALAGTYATRAAADQAQAAISAAARDLYAEWTDRTQEPPQPPVPTTYTVTFTGEGVTETTVTVEEGETVTLPADPVREGYTFDGWFLGETRFDGSEEVTANITLTARWTEVQQPPVPVIYYTVTFTGEGVTETRVTVEAGTSVTLPADPVREGYTFDGWFLGETRFDGAVVVNGDMVLIARWSAAEVPDEWGSVALTVTPGSVASGGMVQVTITNVPENAGDLFLTLNGDEVALDRNEDGSYTGAVAAPTATGVQTLTFVLSAEEYTPKLLRTTITVTQPTSGGTTTGGGVSRPVEEDLDDPDVPLADGPMLYEDVKVGDWFYDAAKYAYENDLMKGISQTLFVPYMNTTRGMVVTILHRMEKTPDTAPASFADVVAGVWYSDGAAWGEATGVVKGANGNFLPTADVTREQLAAFLYRFAEYKGYDTAVRGDLTAFADGANTSQWAADAMSWAVGAGLIQGKGENTLDPQNTATRAEVAVILTRFCENVAKTEAEKA